MYHAVPISTDDRRDLVNAVSGLANKSKQGGGVRWRVEGGTTEANEKGRLAGWVGEYY